MREYQNRKAHSMKCEDCGRTAHDNHRCPIGDVYLGIPTKKMTWNQALAIDRVRKYISDLTKSVKHLEKIKVCDHHCGKVMLENLETVKIYVDLSVMDFIRVENRRNTYKR